MLFNIDDFDIENQLNNINLNDDDDDDDDIVNEEPILCCKKVKIQYINLKNKNNINNYGYTNYIKPKYTPSTEQQNTIYKICEKKVIDR